MINAARELGKTDDVATYSALLEKIKQAYWNEYVTPNGRLVSPTQAFHLLPYAYPVKPGDDAWLARVDEFVSAIKRDGRLEAAAKRSGLTEIVVRK